MLKDEQRKKQKIARTIHEVSVFGFTFVSNTKDNFKKKTTKLTFGPLTVEEESVNAV